METSEQVHPLAPASERRDEVVVDEEKLSPAPATATATNNFQKRRCCGICVAILIIHVVVIVTLSFTVFKSKNPTIRMNNVTFDGFQFLADMNTPRISSNMSLTADVSVKNPNYASFKFPTSTTSIYYHGVVIGDASSPPGRAKARRTMRMKITVAIMTDKLMSQPELMSDIVSGKMEMSTFTDIGGRVKILFVQKHMRVRMNCTMTVTLATQALDHMSCTRKVNL